MRRVEDKGVLGEDLPAGLLQEYLSIQRAEGEPGHRCDVHFDGWVCTRPPDHIGPHFAGACGSPHSCHIYAIWDELPEDMQMDVGL